MTIQQHEQRLEFICKKLLSDKYKKIADEVYLKKDFSVYNKFNIYSLLKSCIQMIEQLNVQYNHFDKDDELFKGIAFILYIRMYYELREKLPFVNVQTLYTPAGLAFYCDNVDMDECTCDMINLMLTGCDCKKNGAKIIDVINTAVLAVTRKYKTQVLNIGEIYDKCYTALDAEVEFASQITNKLVHEKIIEILATISKMHTQDCKTLIKNLDEIYEINHLKNCKQINIMCGSELCYHFMKNVNFIFGMNVTNVNDHIRICRKFHNG